MNRDKTAPIGKWYRRIARVSVGAVLFLILVGGIVRSTGAGMGCPDWPKCFGLIVPPTEVSEIPPSFFEEHPEFQAKSFNAIQTWTEYINRLIGALIGLFMFATAVLSLGYFRKDKRITILSIAALVLTGVEAWLGKLVVDKHLAGGMVTLHMLGAILIVATLITAVYLASQDGSSAPAETTKRSRGLAWLGLGVMLLTVAQILIGTQVREQVDQVAESMNFLGRDTWLSQVGAAFSLHKVLWIIVAGAIVVWVRNMLRANPGNRMIRLLSFSLIGFLFVEVLLGILLGNMDLPPYLQPMHLLVANLIFAAEYGLLVNLLGVEKIFRKQSKEQDIAHRRLANAE